MAGRPRKTTTTTPSTVVVNDENKVKSSDSNSTVELEKLKKENEDLKSQLQMILEKLSAQEENEKCEDNPTSSQEEVIYKEINPLRLINVVSLTDGGVSLRTAPNGGKIFRFDKFGHSIPITYTDLQDVIATDRVFIEDGSVYICDEDVVKNNYLEDVYSKFLTVNMINNIFSFPTDKIIEMVSNTTETIQESIISIIVKKINNNEYVDMNKVDAIGKACKKPCDISALALQKRAK